MRVALDTHILVYAEGVNGEQRKQHARVILGSFAGDEIVIPVQALGELFAVLTRKARWTPATARQAVLGWHASYLTVAASDSALLDAMELVVSYQFSWWDAVILATSAQAGCRLLVSEGMHDGFTWRGTTIRNPFDAPPSPSV
jgi:predicted nucleic acid-binding protein